MVIDAVVGWFLSGITSLMSILPEWGAMTFPGTDGTDPNGITGAFPLLKWTNYYFPVTEALTLLLALGVAMAAIVGYKALEWVLVRTHIAGGD